MILAEDHEENGAREVRGDQLVLTETQDMKVEGARRAQGAFKVHVALPEHKALKVLQVYKDHKV
jgi:hypothetical protein